MKVLFLTSGSRVPSCRFRVLPYIPFLEKEGIKCRVAASFPQKYDYLPWIGFRPSQYLKRLTRWIHLTEAKLRSFDVVYLERELFNDATTEMEQRFRRVIPKMIYDLDDAVFLQQPEKVQLLTSMSDLVVVGNSHIHRALSNWNSRFVTIPTAPSAMEFQPCTERSPREFPVIGWIGTTGNLKYFEVVADALRRLSGERKFELRLIVPDLDNLEGIDLSGVNVRHVAWDNMREAAQVADIDIGIMPLFSDVEWDQYKCPTKVTQYMACGIPSVVSPVGFTADVVEHGIDGFHAADPNQWTENLRQLLDSGEMRETMGQAARKKSVESYSVEANAPKLLAAIQSVYQSPIRTAD